MIRGLRLKNPGAAVGQTAEDIVGKPPLGVGDGLNGVSSSLVRAVAELSPEGLTLQ
jgi:hypothetical protein